MERGGRLADLLAVPAGELLAHTLDDLPLAGDHLQRLGDILTEPGQARPTAAQAGAWSRHDDPLSGQMLRERLAGRSLARERRHRRGRGHPRLGRGDLGGDLVAGGAGLKLFELQLHLIQQPGGALGVRAVALTVELRDLQLQMRDQGLIVGCLGAGDGDLGAGGQKHRLERFNIVRQGLVANVHRVMESQYRSLVAPLSAPRTKFFKAQPAARGRQVACGLRQSIPSRR